MTTPPFYRDPGDGGPIELVVPRPDGSAEVHPNDDRAAHVHLVDLSQALLRRQRGAIVIGREPA